ncbi:uncharacterized protein LOC124912871 [Impatiens glandulifera]|uniref:uncharacterized protein LOC124912871 n=1 Tax=Impatiens glandulifera TaxID=253017 RepID=UPI001FB13A61|nr:uncharacterized protein LOC124912871 [Impatiens glandulifera]
MKKTKVCINLPENEIALAAHQLRSPVCFPPGMFSYMNTTVGDLQGQTNSRSIEDILREVKADVIALQDVKAEEENNMRPLSDLAKALGMEFVFGESWAPQYGNAILSRWPIKRWRVQKICDDHDFRNVLRATIAVPFIGEVNFHCTQLDHLDERWRMKQINAIFQSSIGPHILAGGLNSLDDSDYSSQRWDNIVKYYEEIGKPTPRNEVTRLLKAKGYIDAKDFAGECEPIVMLAKGQNVQGTCKYGTRVDYIMASPDFPYKFVPKTYSIVSSKGTSDHHMVRVDMINGPEDRREKVQKRNITRRTSFNR